MGAKNGMETGHLKSHIEAGQLSVLQEKAISANRAPSAGNVSFDNKSLHPPVLNFLRKSLTAPFEVGPGGAFTANDALMVKGRPK